MTNQLKLKSLIACAVITASLTIPGTAQAVENSTEERIERLEEENRKLRQALELLMERTDALAEDSRALRAETSTAKAPKAQQRHVHSQGSNEHQHEASNRQVPTSDSVVDHGLVSTSRAYSQAMTDHNNKVNRKQLHILESKQKGLLPSNGLVIGGQVTAIANYWNANRDGKFGYLMRHPTSTNQIGKTVSEATLHNAQLHFTATWGDWFTAYGELLYDPEQSFGAGTKTALTRNQVQLRKGYVLLGDLDQAPMWFAMGKMATPFGLTDSVNPFTASTVWHAFGGLAYGAQLGYSRDGLNLTVEAVEGGAQFRAHNAPVQGTSVPSRINNFVADINYTAELDGDATLLLGGSYTAGSAYCQGFPVTHFSSCADANPAWAAYSQASFGEFLIQGEYAQTTDVWAGTHNPTPPLNVFEASKVQSWGLGGKWAVDGFQYPVTLSLDFSTFIAGPEDAPWERQNQWVLGAAVYPVDGIKLFWEIVHVEGYAPLNFISGGNLAPGTTHSDRDATSTGVVMGVTGAF